MNGLLVVGLTFEQLYHLSSPEMNVLTQKQNMQARKPHTYAYAEFLEARCMFEIGFFRWVKLWGQ